MKYLFGLLSFLLCVNVSMGEIMKIGINDTDYEIIIDENQTAQEVFKQLPDTMQLSEYGNHEYFANLGFPATTTDEQTSNLLAGHIYYWASGNAFVINYADFDITPYKSVHIGEFLDKSVCDILHHSDDDLTIFIKRKGEQ